MAGMNAQISFIDGNFSLIHIPLPLYFNLLQPILRVLLPHGTPNQHAQESFEYLLEDLSIEDKHGFLNISVTPIECSIVCHTEWATTLFQPVIDRLPKEAQKQVSISKDSYMIFSVNSAGMEAGQRVMELTGPLALAGISIFFITTYYTDFILVPSKDHKTVVQALLERGLEFSETDSAYVAPTPASHSRVTSTTSHPPATPPPSNVAELQVRTLGLLKRRNVVPFVESGLHLVLCSGTTMNTSDSYTRPSSNGLGNNGKPSRESWFDHVDTKLYLALISALTSQPRFLSVTLSKEDAPSILIDKSFLPLFGESIAGDTQSDLVPIFLNLSTLPLESTGIVCGIAGKLVEDMRATDNLASELSYLSTARAGAVILSSEGSIRALETLTPLLKED